MSISTCENTKTCLRYGINKLIVNKRWDAQPYKESNNASRILLFLIWVVSYGSVQYAQLVPEWVRLTMWYPIPSTDWSSFYLFKFYSSSLILPPLRLMHRWFHAVATPGSAQIDLTRAKKTKCCNISCVILCSSGSSQVRSFNWDLKTCNSRTWEDWKVSSVIGLALKIISMFIGFSWDFPWSSTSSKLLQPSNFFLGVTRGSPLMEPSWCLSDEHRVVLGPSAQDADGALQLLVAASDPSEAWDPNSIRNTP